MAKSKTKMGKGVAALTEVPGGLKMDPKNVRRRERAAELRVAREKVAKSMAIDDSIADWPTRIVDSKAPIEEQHTAHKVVDLHTGKLTKNKFDRRKVAFKSEIEIASAHAEQRQKEKIRDAADLKAGIDPEYLKALESLDPPERGRTTVTFYDGMDPHAAERLKEAIDAAAARPRTRTGLGDDPVPVRLSVMTLASDFAKACAAAKEADAALDAALAGRLLAKAALDAEVARLANEVG
mgnify:CR=1 FL=1